MKHFMDIIIRGELRNGALSGYDIIVFIQTKFQLLLSPGIVYGLLYSLERKNLICGAWNERKRVYELTEMGTQTLGELLRADDAIHSFTANLLKLQ
jgi:DNA-binding PadR family transcriptional regulator